MKIVHLCSYYAGSGVYKNLTEQLAIDGKVARQYIWVPTRNSDQANETPSAHEGIKVVYKKCLNRLTRLSFLVKLFRLVFCFERQSEHVEILQACSVIHAHTLYSDGYLAYWLSRKYRIPYVLSVRTTDVSVFERFLPHWRWMTRRVIANAQCLIFVSPAHKLEIEARYADCLPKTLLIPNGLEDYWIRHALCDPSPERQVAPRGIYIGEINANKNIKRAILAFFEAAGDDSARFTVLGGEYSTFRATYGELPEMVKSRVDFMARTNCKKRIRELLRRHQVLVMPSHMETFGLTYLEAISQCVPVIFSYGQGIDGLYPEGMVGFGCDPKRVESITNAIRKVYEQFPEGLVFENANPVQECSWQSRAHSLLTQAY